MSLGDMIANALASSALVGAVGTVGWLLFRRTIARWVDHQFDTRLEAVKAEYKQDEERLKHDLAEQRRQIDALQNGALSGMAARNAMLDKRRIEALERVWGAAAYLQAHHQLVVMSTAIGFDQLSKLSKDPKGQELIETMLKMAPPSDDFQKPDNPLYRMEREQLFVPPLVWAMFDAYRAVIFLPFAMLIAIKGGLDVSDMWDMKRLHDLIKVALPEAVPELSGRGAKARSKS